MRIFAALTLGGCISIHHHKETHEDNAQHHVSVVVVESETQTVGD